MKDEFSPFNPDIDVDSQEFADMMAQWMANVYTHCMVSIHAEPTFERLRYLFGGDRPSQTAHLTMSPDLIQGRRLEFRYSKSGIPRMTPLKLAS